MSAWLLSPSRSRPEQPPLLSLHSHRCLRESCSPAGCLGGMRC